MMKSIARNPLTCWIAKLARSKMMEFQYRDKNLKIGYLSSLRNCTFGLYVTIYDNVSLYECTLGDFTYVTSRTNIARTTLGKYCSVGPDCKIGLGKHPSKEFVSTHPIFFSISRLAQISFADRSYFEEFDNIAIGNDVWIGANVIVIDGIRIGDGAIVAAGSVVTKDVPPYAIVGGVPAKVIRFRFEQYQIEKLLEIKWWDMNIDYLKNDFKKFHNIDDFLK